MKPPAMGSTAARLMRSTLCAAVRMPRPVARSMFGPPPTNDRGAALDWQTHVFLNLMEAAGAPDLHELGADEARIIYRRSNRIFDVEPRPMRAIDDIRLEGPEGALDARVYRPREGMLPACVYYHGGGFVMGGLDGYDGLCSKLAECADCVVISVDYRLAPEHPFPAAVDDAIAAYEDVVARAASLGVDPERIAVAGDSAGGNLAAVVCQQVLGRDVRPPHHQLLIYPKTDIGEPYPSHELFADDYFLTSSLMDWFVASYVAGAEVDDDPRVSPISFDRLAALPAATIVTAGFDPLRDEGEAYAERLTDAGVFVQSRCCDRLVHSFATMGRLIDAAAVAMDDVCAEFRAQLHDGRGHDGTDSN